MAGSYQKVIQESPMQQWWKLDCSFLLYVQDFMGLLLLLLPDTQFLERSLKVKVGKKRL